MRSLWRRADDGLAQARARLPSTSYSVPDGALLGLFALLLVSFSVGDRIGPSGTSSDWVRSLHFVDLLFPLLGLVVLLHWRDVVDGLGDRLSVTLAAWIVLVFTLGQLGILLTGLWRDPFAVFAGIAFAGKELEYVTLLAFGFIVGSRAPSRAAWLVLAVGVGLLAWMVKEVLAPTGYYYAGLPFATGAVQTGTVYAMLGLAMLGSLGLREADPAWQRWALAMLGSLLAIGVVLSGSRSAMLGLAAGAGVYAIQWVRDRGPLGRRGLAFSLLAAGAGTAAVLVLDPAIVQGALGRWSSAGGGLAARWERWSGLLGVLAAKPWLIPFGAGLGSPNFLYFGEHWGLLLQVVSGYVRRVFEVGVVGFAVFVFLLGQIASQGERYRAGSALPPLTAAIMALSLPMEAFQVSQAAGLFYTFAGLCLGRELLAEAHPSDGPVEDEEVPA